MSVSFFVSDSVAIASDRRRVAAMKLLAILGLLALAGEWTIARGGARDDASREVTLFPLLRMREGPAVLGVPER